MANPQLVAYIREQRGSFTTEALMQTLLAAGWQAHAITEAFEEVEGAPVVQPLAVPPTPISSSAAILAPTATPVPTLAASPVPPHISLQASNVPPVKLAPAPASPNAFIAEMQRRRQEAEALHPNAVPVVGSAPDPVPSSPAEPIAEQMGIVGFLIKKKLAKNEKQANMIMLGVIGASFMFILWYFFL